MGTIIFLSVITVLVLVGIVLSIVLIKKSKNSDSGIISDKLGIYEKKLEIKLIATGIFAVLIYQQIQNTAMTIGVLPIIGITLPFISYGGSSLISFMILIGIILNADINMD